MSDDPPKETYYSRNKDRLKAQAREYAAKNRDKYRSYFKKYYQANKTTLAAKHKAYVDKNKEKINEKQRTIYYPNHQAKKKGEAPPPKEASAPKPKIPLFPVEENLPPIVKQEGNFTVSFK